MTRDECYTGARVYYTGYRPGEIDGTMVVRENGSIVVHWDNGYSVDDYEQYLDRIHPCDEFIAWVRKVRSEHEAGRLHTGD